MLLWKAGKMCSQLYRVVFLELLQLPHKQEETLYENMGYATKKIRNQENTKICNQENMKIRNQENTKIRNQGNTQPRDTQSMNFQITTYQGYINQNKPSS